MRPHWLTCLKAWYQVGETIWEGLGGVVLQEASHWGGGWGFKSPHHSQLAIAVSYGSSNVPVYLLPCSLTRSETGSPINAFFFSEVALVMVFETAIEE